MLISLLSLYLAYVLGMWFTFSVRSSFRAAALAPFAGLAMGVVGLPAVWLLWRLGQSVRGRRWAAAGMLTTLIVTLTAALAWVMLTQDDPLAPGEQYTYANAWWIVPPGVFAASLLHLAAAPVEMLMRGRWRL